MAMESGESTERQPLKLTDYIDPATLQDIQDALAMAVQSKATIRDAQGRPLTQTAVSERFSMRSAEIAAARREKGDAELDNPFSAPIVVSGQTLATIVLEPSKAAPIRASAIAQLAVRLQLPAGQVRAVIEAMHDEGMGQRTASVQFLFLLANALSRLCAQEVALRQRINELQALFNISSMLTGSRGLQQILDRITRGTAEALQVKGCSLRLLDAQRDELVIKSVWGLSEGYLKKGPVLVRHSPIDRQVLAGHPVHIANMATDERVLYPQESLREGIVSGLVCAMRFKDQAVGVLRVYTGAPHEFTDVEVKLLQSIASQAAVAIENARLQEEALDKQRLEQQVQIAAEVQRRMLPAHPPVLPGFDIAALYVPCFELGGDFYDFVPLPGNNLGITVADVVGKGLPASLLMTSVRAAMRAHMSTVYDIDEIIRKVNHAMALDMRSNEFVTLWYGVLNYADKRLTYCNAGHEPPLLVRDGKLIELGTGGMVMGVDGKQEYDKAVVSLRAGDVIYIYTDGVPDALNFQNDKFGKPRMKECLLKYVNEPAEQICRQMLWETRRFVGLNRRTDDTTIVVVKVVE